MAPDGKDDGGDADRGRWTRIPRPRKFHGAADSIDTFEEHCRAILDTHHIQGDEARDWVINQLGGEAYSDIISIISDTLSTKDIFQQLRWNYGSSKSDSKIVDDFYKCKQKSSESKREFCKRLVKKGQKATKLAGKGGYRDIDDAQLSTRLIHGLRDKVLQKDLKSFRANKPDATFSEIRTRALLSSDEDSSDEEEEAAVRRHHTHAVQVSPLPAEAVSSLERRVEQLEVSVRQANEGRQLDQNLQQARHDATMQALEKLQRFVEISGTTGGAPTDGRRDDQQEGCFTCGSRDHYKRDCPTRRQPAGRQPGQPAGRQPAGRQPADPAPRFQRASGNATRPR